MQKDTIKLLKSEKARVLRESQESVVLGTCTKVSSMNSWNSSINELQKKLEKAEKESTVQKDTIDTAMARCKEQVHGSEWRVTKRSSRARHTSARARMWRSCFERETR